MAAAPAFESERIIIPYAEVRHVEPTADDCLVVVTSISRRPAGQHSWDNAAFITPPDTEPFKRGFAAWLRAQEK